jgi:hypothetical protein
MLLALLRFSEDNPVAVLPSSMVSRLPFWVDDWAFTDLHDAVARHKVRLTRSRYQLDVSPLVTVMMHIVGDLTE